MREVLHMQPLLIPEDIWERWKKAADGKGLSVLSLVCLATDIYLEPTNEEAFAMGFEAGLKLDIGEHTTLREWMNTHTNCTGSGPSAPPEPPPGFTSDFSDEMVEGEMDGMSTVEKLRRVAERVKKDTHRAVPLEEALEETKPPPSDDEPDEDLPF